MRLYDHRTGQVEELPRRLHIHVPSGASRVLVVADLLRRVAQRAKHRPVTVTRAAAVPAAPAFNIPDLEVAAPPDAIEVSPAPDAHLVVHEIPDERTADPLTMRLAWLRIHHRDPDDVDLHRAESDLASWRSLMAEWANAPGRPLNREYVAEAESALVNDLDSPTALAVLDRLIADPDVQPGAKLETVIHLDMLLALDLVRDIGRT
ncbi:hypothetical protein [Actinomadura rudentiformis]|uniref:Uncharacterized protein n=1 Tax=Actinomadura rudentiformis TaxID=359158 RepID=A0A6H9Y9W9_9ACTN|nr:hypothetical protein [Actinomadura rudentiformis]KAB2341310.1 hypothetical protein F8566_42075 [Actinomadura rudentiformis]